MLDLSQDRSARFSRQKLAGGLPDGPLTVAFFSSSPGGRYSFEKWLMWRGIAEAAREYGINLVYVSGEEFEFAPQAVLYNLIGKHNVNGLIIWSSFVSQHSSIERTQQFINQFQPLPVVSVELELAGCSNLMVDDIRGVRDILAHLIDQHGYRRIAFIAERNNHASNLRQRAFRGIMEDRGLFDPTLVGSFEELEASGIRWGVDCQAVMAHVDETAVHLVETLQQRGLRVPEDIVVTGFNDGQEARGLLPPLTTVRLPFRSLGRLAVELLVKRVMGEKEVATEVATDVVTVSLAPQLVLRRSCGCLEPMAQQAAAGPLVFVREDFRQAMPSLREALIHRISSRMGTTIENLGEQWAVKLLDIFFTELERHLGDPGIRMPSDGYLQALNDLLREVVLEGSNVTRWHEAVSILRQTLLPYLHGHTLIFAEDLWQQARVLIGQIGVRSEVQRAWRAEQRIEILRGIQADLLISFEFEELLEILVRGLSRLGVRNFYLVLYENYADETGQARLALAYQDGQRVVLDPAQQVFPARNLLPDGLLSKETSYGLVIEALTLREEQIGFIVFKTDPPADSAECDIYPALRIELSSALKGIRLRQKLHDARRQAEEADQLKSRFLSMVSHELRTPLNLIVGLSEMAMRQQSRGKGSLQVIEKFLEQIYVSGQHLDRLIRDVLDLASSQAGQMNLICKQVDLVPVLNDAANIGQQLAGQKNLVFRADVPQQLPYIWGDRTRLRQILLNLLSNAVKFTAHGEVILRAVVEDGNITISVADTGLGIAKEEQELIFSEFHQTDRTTARGYGGIGLGLAITRRLVEMHGGRIWVTSNGLEGGGSNFHFSIPTLIEQFAVAEDDAGKRDGIVQILTKTRGGAQKLLQRMIHHGFVVEELALDDHPNFMEMLMTTPPGAVVLDLAPAAELGWEIMKRMKETPFTQDIPVLFYSLMTEEDVGAVFEMDYLTKPVGTEQLLQALERHGLKASGQKDGKTILIIDDEQGILDLHARMIQLELPQCKVLTAQTGYQGLEIMRNISPDLVLLDLMMPELDGFGVLRLMQEEQMLRGIPVIILSAQVLTEREMSTLNQGVAAVLGKGLFTTTETIARIESALSRNKRLGSETQRMIHHGMAFIHEHYREQISRAGVANHLSVNEQYLSRAFNRELGVGPMAYLSRYRIQQAKRLLEDGTMSITQIALEVGFTSQSYFSRIFQQETGFTPSAYQRGERN